MIRASFHRANGIRTGTLRLGDDHYTLASWHRAADGVLLATTDAGVEITMTSDGANGGALTMAGRHWWLRDLTRDGDTLTGEAVEGVSDQWMAEAFGEGWGE